jgi:hypothetical protein
MWGAIGYLERDSVLNVARDATTAEVVTNFRPATIRTVGRSSARLVRLFVYEMEEG